MKENIQTTCYYCRGTGRTADNPNECVHCGAKYKVVDINKKSTDFFIPNKIKELAINWTPLNVREFVQSHNSRVGNELFQILNFLYSITIDTKFQAIINLYSYTYEIILLSWAYHILILFKSVFSDLDTSIHNLAITDNLKDLTEQPILIIEVTDYEVQKTCDKIYTLLCMRKRLGRPTFVFSRSVEVKSYFNLKAQFTYDMKNHNCKLPSIVDDDLFNTILVVNEE